MKKSLFLISFFLISLLSFAQMTVESVKELPTDLTAKMNKRLDLNGKSCALVRIEMRSPEAKFEGNVIGEIAYTTSEYLVYLSPGTRTLKMSHPNQLPLIINFNDFGISELSESTTYSVRINMPLDVKVVDVEELLKAGNKNFEEGRFNEAFDFYQKASEYNSPQAFFMLSMMYDQGKGVEKNAGLGHNYCIKAAELGFPQAQYNLGVNLFNGTFGKTDMKEGLEWFLKAANQGEPHAMYNLGIAYEHGYGCDKNLDEAEYWYCKASDEEPQDLEADINEGIDRVQKLISDPECDFQSLNLWCTKGNKAYCFTPETWQSIPDSKKKYYNRVGIFFKPGGGEKPFVVTMTDDTRNIGYQEASKYYDSYLLKEHQAKLIAELCEPFMRNCKIFTVMRPSGSYWVRTDDEAKPKGLIFADDEAYAAILPLTPTSMSAVRPIITLNIEGME